MIPTLIRMTRSLESASYFPCNYPLWLFSRYSDSVTYNPSYRG
uniref:Uncharacterized protein n=1 Tax=Rhizophora mucronata TaxID=61149 RepID=A0A2P2PP87_RHIMU